MCYCHRCGRTPTLLCLYAMCDEAGKLRTTQWSLVDRAAAETDQPGRPALAELLRQYLPALRSHLVIRKQIRPDQAEDLIQGFISEKVLQQGLFARADRTRGRFRSLVLTALDRYVVDQLTRRTPGQLDPGYEAVDAQPRPSEAFDQAWARQVIDLAIRRMQAECQSSGRNDLWEIFECRIVAPAIDRINPLPYEPLVRRFGFRSVMQAANVLTTAKRMFGRILRAVIAEYVDEADIEAELKDLLKTLSGRA